MAEIVQKILTGADFDSEDLAWEHFDAIADKSDAFYKIHREVEGWYIQPRSGICENRPRIDRIVIPSSKLISAGWPHGPFGVEGKKSGKKIGKVIAQSMDYSRAVFELPHGFLLMLNWVFIWPLDGAAGDIASVMAQNRIGWVKSYARNPLVFGCCGTNGISLSASGEVEAKPLPMGNKVGSR